jgi:hypothetical protein
MATSIPSIPSSLSSVIPSTTNSFYTVPVGGDRVELVRKGSVDPHRASRISFYILAVLLSCWLHLRRMTRF